MAIADAVLEDRGLPALFKQSGLLKDQQRTSDWPTEGRGMVISGSCSEATNRQVAEMSKHRPSRKLDPLALASDYDREVEGAVAFALKASANGPTLIYSTSDPQELKAIQVELGQRKASELTE